MSLCVVKLWENRNNVLQKFYVFYITPLIWFNLQYRFNGYDADNTYLIISEDLLRLQCRSISPSNSYLCGRSPLNVPSINAFTPHLVFRGGRFHPRDGSHHNGQTERSKYTWSATYYRLLWRMGECDWLGENFIFVLTFVIYRTINHTYLSFSV